MRCLFTRADAAATACPFVRCTVACPCPVLAFSTEHPFYNGTAQNAWMEADLKAANANRENVPWIFMYGHRPFYCSTDDYYDCEIFAKDKLGPNVEWMLKKYNVDVYGASVRARAGGVGLCRGGCVRCSV